MFPVFWRSQVLWIVSILFSNAINASLLLNRHFANRRNCFQGSGAHEVRKKTLCQVLSIRGRMAESADECEKRFPLGAAKVFHRGLGDAELPRDDQSWA